MLHKNHGSISDHSTLHHRGIRVYRQCEYMVTGLPGAKRSARPALSARSNELGRDFSIRFCVYK